MRVNEVSGAVVDAAIMGQTTLGPRWREPAYAGCLAHELSKGGHAVQVKGILPVLHDGVRIDVGYRLDLLVDDLVILELKAVEKLAPINEAQLPTYLKLSGRKVGSLIKFNVLHLKGRIKRMVNNLDFPSAILRGETHPCHS